MGIPNNGKTLHKPFLTLTLNEHKDIIFNTSIHFIDNIRIFKKINIKDGRIHTPL